MTIDEAIAHERELSERSKQAIKDNEPYKHIFFGWNEWKSDRTINAEYHKQVAKWLEELKMLRLERMLPTTNEIIASKVGYEKGYNKAIDDFVDKLKPKLNEKIKGWTNSDDLIRWCNNSVDETAEQLKECRENE